MPPKKNTRNTISRKPAAAARNAKVTKRTKTAPRRNIPTKPSAASMLAASSSDNNGGAPSICEKFISNYNDAKSQGRGSFFNPLNNRFAGFNAVTDKQYQECLKKCGGSSASPSSSSKKPSVVAPALNTNAADSDDTSALDPPKGIEVKSRSVGIKRRTLGRR